MAPSTTSSSARSSPANRVWVERLLTSGHGSIYPRTVSIKSIPRPARARSWIGFVFLHVASPIVVGGLMYVLWRSPSLAMFSWFADLGLLGVVERLRSAAEPLAEVLPRWFLHTFPDAAWAYAGTVLFARIWAGRPGRVRWLWIGAIPVLSLGSEIGQAVGVVPGTFTLLDLFSCTVAVALALRVGLGRG